ncbi:MAG: hypothetical protein JNL90_05610 [Planctomycetes bacterium]|nr:hypothetical protein [Planctomycetota bacterium]
MVDAHPIVARRHAPWAAPRFAALLLVALCAAGCSSPQAVVGSSNPDQVGSDVRALYVVVAPDAKLDPEKVRPADRDAIALLRDLDLDALSAYVQLRPALDAKRRLLWEVVDQRFVPAQEPLVDLGIDGATGPDGRTFQAVESPLEVTIDGDLLEREPATALLLVVQWKNGAAKASDWHLVGTAAIATGATFAFDVRDGALHQTR